MSLQNYFAEAYETDKIAVELQYETLMQQEQQHHKERMDAYSAMRREAMERLQEKYGHGFEPPTAAATE